MQRLSALTRPLNSAFQKFLYLISLFPFVTFLVFLGLLFGLIVAGNRFRQVPPTPPTPEPAAVPVTVFQQDGQPMLDMTARIEKSGVVTIVAQAPGIVRNIKVTEGKEVKGGTVLVNLASNYQGGNAAAVSRQLAQRSYQFNAETYDAQKDVINRQKDLARNGETIEREVREIGRKSFDDTKTVISANEDIVRILDQNIKDLEAIDPNDPNLLILKGQRAQALGGLTSLRSALRSSEYQFADDKTPAKTAEAARDLTIKQLELQEKSLDLTKDISALNVKLARVAEQAMYPAAPCGGVIERVYVKEGQAVNPGTPIATLRMKETEANAIVAVPAEIARQVNRMEPTMVTVNGKQSEVYPRYVSAEATEGSLYGIFYTLPDNLGQYLTEGSTVSMKVPIGGKKLSSGEAIAPIDSIYQTSDKAYLYVIKKATASAEAGPSGQVAELREVELGDVTGEYVQVVQGIQPSDSIITSRGVTAGQKVTTK